MFGMETLNILIGLATVYLMFGMACTAVVEAIMQWFDVRSKNLEDGMKELLAGDFSSDTTFVKAFYAHPLIQSLSKNIDGRPAYIPAAMVAQVVEALLTDNGKKSLSDAIELLPGGVENRFKGILKTFNVQAQNDIEVFRKAIETQFNATMDRSSGWLKQRSHNFAFVVSLLLVVGANVDTVSMANALGTNPDMQVKMVELAQKQLQAGNESSAQPQEKADALKTAVEKTTYMKKTVSDLESAGLTLKLGWTELPNGFGAWVSKIAGLIVSVFAVSLGAPFWFDILNRFMQIRTSGSIPKATKT